MTPDQSTSQGDEHKAGTSKVRENEFPRGKDAVDSLLDAASGLFGKAKEALRDVGEEAERLFANADKEVAEAMRGVGAVLEPVNAVIKSVIRSPEAKQAIEASAHVWTLVSQGDVGAGFVKTPDGSVISDSFESFEGLKVGGGDKETIIAIGTVAGKKHFLSLSNPAELTSFVSMGREGFDEIRAFSAVLVGEKGGAYYVIDPATGGRASQTPIWTKSPSENVPPSSPSV